MLETIEAIMRDEGGYKSEVYLCSTGKLTWLYGRNIDDRPITEREWEMLKSTLTNGGTQEDWAKALFYNELSQILRQLQVQGVVLYDHDVSASLRAIILNLAYNMGTTRFNPKNWPKFFAAFHKRDGAEMARQLKYADPDEGRLSLWWNQVDNHDDNFVGRAERLYKALKRERSKCQN